jgi:L-alanine-DL-glutamate epimerase-like enolase superfamily enzyme
MNALKIKKVDYWIEHFRLTNPYTIASGSIEAVDIPFVRIETHSGLCGLGAASPGMAVTGENDADCRAALNSCLERLLLGQDIRKINTLVRNLPDFMPQTPAARAAIDISLYDVYAKYLGMPLVDVLGRVRRSLPTSITIGIESIRESLEEARECVKRGFRILKVKIGKSLDNDIERLHRLREETGSRILIRVDINQGYTPEQYKSFIQKTATLDLEFIEQPLNAGDINSMRGLPESLRAVAAADESLISPADALNFTCPPRPFGIYNIKLMKCGGIYPALQIADIARIAGIDLMWGCNDESILSIAAALHAALSSPATRYIDLDGSLDLERDIVKGGFVLENGELSLTGEPGLGVEL